MSWNTPSKHTIVLDTTGDTVVDSISNAVESIDTLHSNVHDGVAFDYSLKTTLASSTSAYLLGIPDTLYVHFHHLYIGADDGPIDIELYENPSYSATGTAATTIYNHNRNSSNTETLAIYPAPTITADGTRLFIAGTLSTSTGAHATTDEKSLPLEWVLKPANAYAIKLTNNGSSTATIYGSFTWYEL